MFVLSLRPGHIGGVFRSSGLSGVRCTQVAAVDSRETVLVTSTTSEAPTYAFMLDPNLLVLHLVFFLSNGAQAGPLSALSAFQKFVQRGYHVLISERPSDLASQKAVFYSETTNVWTVHRATVFR